MQLWLLFGKISVGVFEKTNGYYSCGCGGFDVGFGDVEGEECGGYVDGVVVCGVVFAGLVDLLEYVSVTVRNIGQHGTKLTSYQSCPLRSPVLYTDTPVDSANASYASVSLAAVKLKVRGED